MQIYIPDRWKIIKALDNKIPTYKIFAGTRGGYTSGDSWKLNSGISSYIETQDYYDFYGYSGSIYRCYKSNEGMTLYMQSVYNGIQIAVGKSNFKTITTKTFKRNYAKS